MGKIKIVRNKIQKVLPITIIKMGAFFVILVLAGLSLLTLLPLRTPIKPYIVLSGSMNPTIPEGSIVFVKRGFNDIKKGNIVTFKRPGKPQENVTHRIVGEDKSKGRTVYMTKGDANTAADLWVVPKESIWGKAIFSVPVLGYVISFAKTKLGVILLIALPLVIIALGEARIIYSEIKKMRKKSKEKKAVILLVLVTLFLPSKFAISSAVFSDTVVSANQQISTGDWTPPPIPDLISPTNNSYVNTAGLVMDWFDVTDDMSNPVYYIYQSASNPGFSPLAYESGHLLDSHIPASGTPDGIYYWRVKACDAIDNCSVWSEIWKVTVDNIAPVTTLSFNGKSINEKVLNPGFESGLANWQTEGEVHITAADGFATPYNGTKMARIGHTIDDGQEIWENKLTQQIQPGAKNLSFYYNFFSYDVGTFDDPGMVVRLNDYNVFYLSASDIDSGASPNSSGWTQLSFDISQIPDPVLEIIFYSGNTIDKSDQSWVYIDDISTAEAVANNDQFTLTANEPTETYYSFDGGPFIGGTAFNLDTITGSTLVRYYSVDAAGNIEGINTSRLVKDIQKPDAIIDLIATATSKQTVNLSWTSPSDPPNASSSAVYDIRYSFSAITEDNFYAATPSANPPAPRQAGEFQLFEVSGLNSDTLYYFAIKSADAALNWSEISNPGSDTTLDPTDPFSDPDINPGDVVINELMWMGTSGSADDQYLELRNMTDQVISLKNWTVAGVIIPDGKTLPAQGYFLISNFDKAGSKINVDPDLVDSSLVLSNLDAQYILKDSLGNEIDTADNGEGVPAAGQFDSGGNIYYSMERDATPDNGENADVWHTIFDDSALMHSYWDLDAVEKGTPGGENLSQAVTPTETTLKLSYSDHKVGLTVFNTARFNQLKYTLTYESDSGPQGITGTIDINNQPNLEVKDLFLGTCSSGGTCVYHEGVKQINLEVVLSGAIERTLTTSLAL